MESRSEEEKSAKLERDMSQANAERGLQDEVVGLRQDLKEALAINFQRLQTDLEDQMRRFQTEQSRMGGGAGGSRAPESNLSDSSISGDRPLTKESGYGTAKRKRGGGGGGGGPSGNRVQPEVKIDKPEKSKICVIS